jgi:hypothetical protein
VPSVLMWDISVRTKSTEVPNIDQRENVGRELLVIFHDS